MTDQASGVISYERPRTAATNVTSLVAEYLVSFNTANTAKVEWFVSLDPSAVAQVSTITITSGVTLAEYSVAVTAAGNTRTYIHRQGDAETAESIAAFLAEIMDTNPYIQAKSNANVITVTSVVPGQEITLDGSGSDVPASVVVATTTANAGIAKHRKIGETQSTFAIASNGFPEITHKGTWFDGSANPVVTQTYGPLKGTGNKALDAIQTAQGVDRSV